MRTCAACGHALSKYNPAKYCFACQEAKEAERERKWAASPEGQKAIREAEMFKQIRGNARRYPALEMPSQRRLEVPEVIEVNGVKLVPAMVPKVGWPAVVEAFIASGQECVVVRSDKTAKSLYMSLAKVAKGTACKALVADEHCYLVRVK